MNDRLLAIYLNDHLAGSTAGRMLAQRSLSNNRGTPLGEYLERFLAEAEEDARVLEDVLERIGGSKDPLKQAAAWATERVGRLKLNGRLVGYSPLSRLEEIEGLALGVEGRLSLWRTLQKLSAGDARIAFGYADLISRAERQRRDLERFRRSAIVEAFAQ